MIYFHYAADAFASASSVVTFNASSLLIIDLLVVALWKSA